MTSEVRRLAIGAMLAAHDGDDDALVLLLSDLPEATLVAVVGEVAGLAGVIWATRADSSAAVRDAFATYALQLAAE